MSTVFLLRKHTEVSFVHIFFIDSWKFWYILLTTTISSFKTPLFSKGFSFHLFYGHFHGPFIEYVHILLVLFLIPFVQTAAGEHGLSETGEIR